MNAERLSGRRGSPVLAWQRARWLRVAPGRVGLAIFACLGLCLLLPLGSIGLFDGWAQAALAFASLGALALGVAVGRDTARPHAEELWVFQKGASLADWGLSRWAADTAMASMILLWWSACWLAAAALHGHPVNPSGAAAFLVWLIAVYALVSSLLFAAGAAGSRNGTELVLLLLLLSLAQPLFATGLPAVAMRAAHLLLPPLHAAASLRSTIATGESLRLVAVPSFHLAVFVSVVIGLGAWLLSRRRPLQLQAQAHSNS